jgi:phosphoglycerol transferase MdoB-like AlkP superfamily enzyme
MANAPIFTDTPIIGVAQVSAANTNLNGTGTIVTVVTGSTNGTKITEIQVKAIVTTTAGMVRFYIYDGVNTRLFYEVLVSAITPSATVSAFYASVPLSNLILPSTYEIRASTEKAETFNIIAYGSNF